MDQTFVLENYKSENMRIGIRTLLPHQFYLCKVTFFYQAFLNSTNSLSGKYVNKFWLSHKGRFLIRGFNFRFYRLKCVHYFHSCTKFQLNLKNFVKLMR